MSLSPSLLPSLQKLRLFQDLSPTQIKRVFATCKQETFEPGTTLGETGPLSSEVRSATVSVTEAVNVMAIGRRPLMQVRQDGVGA